MRFNTLERNIKSKTNSFYDSYLDLLEATIKYIMDENNIQYDPTRTCGHIVRTDEAKAFFKETLGVDDYTFNKLPDYIKKCNDHKHKKEKTLQVEGVINFLKVFYDLINYYIDYIKGIRVDFDASYFTSIYGETERLNSEYRMEVLKLKDELKESYETRKLSEQDLIQYKNLLSIKDIELLNLDEQNRLLQEQINTLKDIKLNSMEEKLNKTIDLLTNLTSSVIENRAVSIAIGQSIIGTDITESTYMEKATESIRKKNKSVLGTLENQKQVLNLLGNKFHGVSCDDLLFLADKSREIRDYSNAQEYYKGVLTLDPKNWSAFFYSSALSLYVPNFISDFSFHLVNRSRLYSATIELLNKNKVNENDIVKCIDMFQSDLDIIWYIISQNKSVYLDSKTIMYNYQYAIYQGYLHAKNNHLEKNMKDIATLLITMLNELNIEIDSDITKDDFDEICTYSSISFLHKYKAHKTYK